MATPYVGNSIVDYLKSVGQASDFPSRAKLAATKGIQGYVGSADQNTQLLTMLRSVTPTPAVAPAPIAPAGVQAPSLGSFTPQLQVKGSQPQAPSPQAPAPAQPQAVVSPKGPLTTQRTPDGRYLWLDTTTGQEKGIFNTKAELIAARDKEFAAQQPAPQPQAPAPGATPGTPAAPTAPPASAPVNPISQEEFQMRANETIDQYKERIAARFAEGAAAAPYTQFDPGIGAPPPTPSPISPNGTVSLPQPEPEDNITKVLGAAGIGSVSTDMPIGDLIKTVMSTFGIDPKNPEAANINKEMTTLDDNFAEEVNSVNSNPWISEGLRSKKITQVQEKYERKRNAMVERLRLQKDSQDSNLKLAGLVVDIYFKQKELEKDVLLKNLDIAQKQLEAKTKGTEPLTTAQLQGAIDRVNDDYRQDQVTKQYLQAGTGWSFLSSISPATKNPADDIGAIYAFAKIMDPESVVREGEYATVQRYAQSWAETFGFNAARIFTNTKFLTTEAIKNMQATAGSKFRAIESAHNFARDTYEQRITDLQAGKIVGALPEYGIPSAGGARVSNIQTAPKGEILFEGSTSKGLKYKVIK